MDVLNASEARFTFVSSGCSEELRVLSVTGTEAMSELFHFGLELACLDPMVDLDAVVGEPATLTIASPESTRTIFGIVSRFEQSVSGGDYTPYFAEFVPHAWMLTQRYDSRIFQQKTTQEIITDVLTAGGIESDYFRFALQGTYEPRDYCVQYRETDFDFVSRLMEEEGIFYFFEHVDDKDVLVMADSDDVHVPIEGTSDVLFRDVSGAVEGEEYIYDFRYSQQIRPGKATLKDFNFETPDLPLKQEKAAERDPGLDVYDFPGLYGVDDRGTTLAELRLQALQTRRLMGQGRSVCPRLATGCKFDLADFPRSDLNQEYLIIWMHHEGVQPLGQDDAGGRHSYNNTFRCIPASVPFRPARKTPKPVVEGSQTAIVTGPSGEEIYVDEHGRVKVHFHWDRVGPMDETSSCWIRVSQLWAGASWGAMFIPRIGHEVIVDFIEGDPDRPIITGRVYHGQNRPPYPLDDEKTKSTIKSNSTKGGGGSNEYRFEDKKGSEEIYQHAQKDLTIKTENDKNQNTIHDETLTIGNDRTKTVKHDETTTVENDRTETVNGKETITIKKDRTETVTEGDETVTINQGDRTINVDQGDDTHNVKTGDRTVNVDQGDDTLNVKTGDRTVNVNTGDEALNVKAGKKTDTIKGPYDITVQSDKFHVKCGASELTMKLDGTVELKGIQGKITINASGVKVEGLNVKSVATIANDTSGVMVSSAGQAKNVVQGGLVLINP